MLNVLLSGSESERAMAVLAHAQWERMLLEPTVIRSVYVCVSVLAHLNA